MKRSAKRKNAYAHYNGGMTIICEYPSQKAICRSVCASRAIRKARLLGYNVTIYCGVYTKTPRGAKRLGFGSYVLPALKT